MRGVGALLVASSVLTAQALVMTPQRLPVARGGCVTRTTRGAVEMRLGGFGGKGFGMGKAVSSYRRGSKKTPFIGGWFGSGSNNKQPPKGPKGPLGSSESADEEPEEEKTGLWASYEKALAENPLLIKGLTSLVGFTLGDILAQCFVEKKGPYDPWRTARLASFGFLVHGTTSHWFYGKLDGRIPGTAAADVATKVFIDQVLWNPIFGCMFFGYMGILEGSGIKGAYLKIKNDLITQVTGSWTVWPLAHAINFKFVPTEQRVLYINTIQIFYNCFLSIIGSRKPDLENA